MNQIHRDKYGVLIDELGRETIMMIVGQLDQRYNLKEALERDEHLNTIPLNVWDSRHEIMKYLARYKYWALSDSVCVLKEAARQFVEGGYESDPQG